MDGVVNDIEKTLKSISDDLLNEKCQRSVHFEPIDHVYCLCVCSEVESGGGAV